MISWKQWQMTPYWRIVSWWKILHVWRGMSVMSLVRVCARVFLWCGFACGVDVMYTCLMMSFIIILTLHRTIEDLKMRCENGNAEYHKLALETQATHTYTQTHTRTHAHKHLVYLRYEEVLRIRLSSFISHLYTVHCVCPYLSRRSKWIFLDAVTRT